MRVFRTLCMYVHMRLSDGMIYGLAALRPLTDRKEFMMKNFCSINILVRLSRDAFLLFLHGCNTVFPFRNKATASSKSVDILPL
jgi:hypothetical protein